MNFRMNYLIGDRAFYKKVLMVAVPVMIQNGITNFVNMLDNIMVGQIGTEQMSGVAIVNQLIFVFNVSLFGAISGAGIFGAQFFGKNDQKGLRDTFRFKWIICFLMLATGILVLFGLDQQLITLYLSGSDGDAALTLHYGIQYLRIMLIGLAPFTVTQIYASTLRETGETFQPMMAGVMAVGINLLFNYLLIFGKFGFPQMGVQGAAIATVMSRFVEAGYMVWWTHRHRERNRFIVGAYQSFRIPRQLTWDIIKKGMPLLANEVLWSAGMAMLMQCYSIRGLVVVAALNISNTIMNVFNVVHMSMGSAISILVGQQLGAGKLKEAKRDASRMILFGVALSVCMGVLMAGISPFFPQIYNTSEEVRSLATTLILITAVCLPIAAFMHATYFTLRSGGKTVITFLFDSAFLWAAAIPLAYILSRFTDMPIAPLFFCCQAIDLIKCIIGFVLVKKGVWLNNMVKNK